MPMGKKHSLKRGVEKEHPLKKTLFCSYWLLLRENGCR